MKKFLLMAAIAAGTMSANAQIKLDQTKLQKNFAKVEVATEANTDVTRAMEVPNMYYYRPAGLFYTGWNKGYFNPGISIAPVNTDIHFEANYNSGTPAWAYPDGTFDANGEPMQAEYEGETLDINMEQGRYFTPIVVNLEDQQNDLFAPVGYMEVGGTCGEAEGEYEGEPVPNDAYAVNYVPTGNIAMLPQYLCTNNPDADAMFQGVIGDDTWSTRGFGELFTSTTDFELRGFNVLMCAQEGFESEKTQKKVKASLLEFIPGQGVGELLTSKDMTVKVEITQDPEGDFGVYHMLYTFVGGPIKIKAGQLIVPMVTSTKLQMTPLFDGQPRWDENAFNNLGATTMFVLAETADGEIYRPVPSLALTDQNGNKSFLNSWCFGMDMSYNPEGFLGIDNVVADEVAGSEAVYTVAGVKVADNGNVENLPAGVYVKGGKKFVVR